MGGGIFTLKYFILKVKTTKITNLDGLELKEATFKNKEFPDHFHDTFSIGIITEGVEKIRISENEQIAFSNSVIIFNQFETHSNQNFDKDNCSFLTSYIHQDILHFICKKQNIPIPNRLEFNNLIYDDKLCKSLINFHNNELQDKNLQLENIVTYLLTSQLKNNKKQHSQSIDGKIDAIRSFIHENLYEKLSLSNISEKFKIDKFRLIRQFKSSTGLTPLNYIIMHRLDKSKTMIQQKMPLVEVALECGFYDQSCFTKFFNKYYGISPYNYAKNYFETTF